jgi:hypothetical protein
VSDPVELGGGMLRTAEAATLAWLSQMVAIALEGYAVSRPPATMPAQVGPTAIGMSTPTSSSPRQRETWRMRSSTSGTTCGPASCTGNAALNAQVLDWCDTVTNALIQRTTYRAS